jgi:hypothetical protein
MEMPKEGVSTSGMKKSRNKKTSTPVQEQTPESFDLIKFSREYVPPRKLIANQFRLQKEAKYDMVTLVIPPGVIVEGDMLGSIGNLSYSNHDLTDLKKFRELAPHNYLHVGMNLRSLVITIDPQEWVTGL